MSRLINYILIITGAFVAIYAQAGEQQNQYVLIGGIVVLMLGIYRISRNIPSKKDQDENNQNNISS
ncbi:hypothetical protein [Psychroserpens sp.]